MRLVWIGAILVWSVVLNAALPRVTVTDRRSRETKRLDYQLKVIAP